jgi:hypothetical protein
MGARRLTVPTTESITGSRRCCAPSGHGGNSGNRAADAVKVVASDAVKAPSGQSPRAETSWTASWPCSVLQRRQRWRKMRWGGPSVSAAAVRDEEGAEQLAAPSLLLSSKPDAEALTRRGYREMWYWSMTMESA